MLSRLADKLEHFIFTHRAWIIALFALATLGMAAAATQLRIDAGFNKLLPLKHEYMQTFTKYQQEFGGANRIVIALMAKDGNIFTPEFFRSLQTITNEVLSLPGVDQPQVRSLFTPNVRFTEVVEEGILAGDMVPADFSFDQAGLEQVRKNILKSDILGRLVANDFSGAIVSAELLEIDPATGERLNYIDVAEQLEQKIRSKYQSETLTIDFDVHIIGFAKVIGDITEGAGRVVLFFLIAFVITAVLVYFYSQSFRLSVLPLACSLVAVVWQLGLLTLLGFGIDPMSILVPFLVFAIGVSHGVQMVGATKAEVFVGKDGMQAARDSFRRLLTPGVIALASDTIGFITILLIQIGIIQEMAITASLGVAMIILTNLVLLPVLLSYVRYDDNFKQRLDGRVHRMIPIWERLARVAQPRPAAVIIVISIALFFLGAWKAGDVKIGDLHRGVPELHADARYNIDSEIISEKFSIGVDVMSVIVETMPEGCINYDVMALIDRFEWHMRNVPGVQSVIALPSVAKVINAGWNEGSPKWRILPRNQEVLVQSVAYVPTSSGLLNNDCSVMPVYIFTGDHKAETISTIIDQVKGFQAQYGTDTTRFLLATGNVGVMAATNEAVEAAQFPMLLYVFSAIIILCLLTFRSLRATLCIVIPLGLVSLLAYALMALLDIGLKVSTLPVVALGVGIGVDYGIYIYSRFQDIMKQGTPLREAYHKTLMITGNGVLFTAVTLAIGVITWIFSPLKFQADMGILLTFMFLVNALGAILLLPALASWLLRGRH